MGEQSRVHRRGHLQVLADQEQMTVAELIGKTIREEQTVLGAAQKLGVAPNTIRHWLKKLGFVAESRPSIVWVQQEPEIVP